MDQAKGAGKLRISRSRVWTPPQKVGFEFEMPSCIKGYTVGKVQGSASGPEGYSVYFEMTKGEKTYKAVLRFPNRGPRQG